MSAPTSSFDVDIVISEQERRNGRLSIDNGRLGTMLLHTRGYVVLSGAVPHVLLAELRSSFRDLYEQCARDFRAGRPQSRAGVSAGTGGFWARAARFRIFPPLTGPFASTYVLRNPFAHSIIAETLGADYYCKSLSSDTCVDGSIKQGPHRDISFYRGDGTLGCIVNIALTECGLHNGPMEVWPGGSHFWHAELFDRFNLTPFIQDEPNPQMETLVRHLPSKLIQLQPGELMIRDPGMLHRGTPNTTDDPRMMLTAGYYRNDYYFPYGDTRHNLDDELYRQLDPDVQQLFKPLFDKTDPRYGKWRNHGEASVSVADNDCPNPKLS